MEGRLKTMRRLLFRLWSKHARDVSAEGRRLDSQKESVERAYTAGFRDGYFGAVVDLVQEGMVEPPLDECSIAPVAPVHGTIH